MQTMTYPINPVAKPRQTQSDKWKKRPIVMRYRAFKDLVRLYGVKVPVAGAKIMFVIPMPKSWSDKKLKRMNYAPHQQVPDVDNLLKGLLDAIYADDSCVWHIAELSKVWGETGSIVIDIPQTSTKD